ncbi:MAG: RNA methyltransferase [Planctomycetes bacterium]|nr:RNA methyltransferase [Planctomycetota bacterium]
MTIHRIASLEDRRLDPYRHLRTSNLTRFSGRFIAESRPLVQRLLASPLAVESVLIDERFLEEAMSWVPETVSVLVVPSDAIAELVGFHFHRGYLACGIRPAKRTWPEPETGSEAPHAECHNSWTGAYLIGVQDPENMGSILRSCAAFGIQDVLIGPECVDPFARRVLRVSMGNAFKIHLFDAPDPIPILDTMHAMNTETVAACLRDDSVELIQWQRQNRVAVLLGNEAHGLPADILDSVSQRVKISMELGTDSLNVSVAAGIFLHRARPNQDIRPSAATTTKNNYSS